MTISVVQGRIFTMDARGSDEFVVCLDAATGKEIWRFRSDGNFINDQGNGPRAQPTVDGNLLYAFGAQGSLYALSASDGTKVWEHNQKTLEAKIPIWGYASSPLVEGNLLILPVGGAEGNAVVTFDKKTGSIVWKSATDEPGYSSPVAVTVNGVRQIIVLSGTMLLSVSPADGKVLWKYPWRTDWFVNAAVPIFIPSDKIFISTDYGHGAALLRVRTGGVDEIWLTKSMKNHFNSSVLFDGEKSIAQALQGKCWTQPTLSDGKLYLRNQKEMVCLQIGG